MQADLYRGGYHQHLTHCLLRYLILRDTQADFRLYQVGVSVRRARVVDSVRGKICDLGPTASLTTDQQLAMPIADLFDLRQLDCAQRAVLTISFPTPAPLVHAFKPYLRDNIPANTDSRIKPSRIGAKCAITKDEGETLDFAHLVSHRLGDRRFKQLMKVMSASWRDAADRAQDLEVARLYRECH